MPQEDRRQKRSTDPLVALHYQLAHARARGSLEAIVVADADGVVVAGAGSWAACEELAAFAPLLASRAGADVGVTTGEASRVDVVRREAAVTSFQVDDQEVHLCARGGGLAEGRAVTLAAALTGVARILRAAA